MVGWRGGWAVVGLVVVALAGSCSEGDPTDCHCSGSIGESTFELECGEQRCIGSVWRICDLAQGTVIDGDACGGPDLANPSTTCPALGAHCSPGGPTCCALDGDGGVVPTLSCDPTALVCCAATGAPCRNASDCCPGRGCMADPAGNAFHCSL